MPYVPSKGCKTPASGVFQGRLINLNAQQRKDHFKTYKDKYKKAHTKSKTTGFGITSADPKAGIKTIPEKLDKICPLYDSLGEDLEKLVEYEEEETLGSSESSSDDLNSSVIDPLLRDPKEKHQFHLNATLEVGKSLEQQVQFDIKDFNFDSDQDGGEKTIINDFREYEADDLPSGNELLNPVSKSNPNKSNSQINKDDGLNTTSRDKSSSNEPTVSPKHQRKSKSSAKDKSSGNKPTVSPKHQRKSKSSAKLTAAELALDDPTDEDKSGYSPSKKTVAKNKEKTTRQAR
ncbi:hypothetical protein MJO28_013225 [Puccinia striiformis f. sp. tritici]|uniref:Uncharacterized protein n=1 Tax=Puccinia striiformis f. sp. tritici TaxID=168172 RepID=A0ACC0DYT5_9BASI|nr:hypothetical protein MJO28_013225 [Puccinia striiformis f. sp. tritici]